MEIAKKYREDELNKVIAERNSWPVLYHFSHIRQNILEWAPITKNDKVLEIGSGCGAITGVLARKAGEVTCIELSKMRSTINAYRNRDCDNVKILVGNFQDIEKNMKEQIDNVLSTLTEKEAQILRYRFGLNGKKSMSLKEVGEVFNLSKERIRQIKIEVCNKLKDSFSSYNKRVI